MKLSLGAKLFVISLFIALIGLIILLLAVI